MLRWQQALCLATIAAFLAAAYYACVAKQQKETMDKTFGEIKNKPALRNVPLWVLKMQHEPRSPQ